MINEQNNTLYESPNNEQSPYYEEAIEEQMTPLGGGNPWMDESLSTRA